MPRPQPRRAALRVWRRRSALERCETLRRAAVLMRERAEAMATVLTLEQGKPLAEALRELRLSADIIDFQAEEARRLYGRSVPPRVDGILSHTVTHPPVGPVAAFTAWNFPVNLPARKLGAALAAGCSVVLKPAEETPASAMALVQCFLDAGLPPEALSLVCGDPAMVSATLIAHPAIRKVSLTGSVAVGRLLAAQCAREGKRFAGELGGHAPVIVCEDADPAFALKLSVPAKFRNAGQVCASPIRFFVHRRHVDAWCGDFSAAAAALRLGPGLDAATQMGPLTHARRIEDMERFVADAREQGARILTGGRRVDRPGFFFEPTVIADAPATSRVMRIEPFGPIAVIQPFDALDEAIAAGQRAGLRPGRLCLHPRPGGRAPPGRRDRGRHGGHQPLRRVAARAALRRPQGQRRRRGDGCRRHPRLHRCEDRDRGPPRLMEPA